MHRSVVCGVDASAESHVAVRVAAQLSARLGLRLVVAHVAEAAVDGTPAVLEPEEVEELRACEILLEHVARDEGLVDAELLLVEGEPAEQLARLADDEDAELILVGSRGHGAFKAALRGSVSRNLISLAHCPVVVVPPGLSSAAAPPRRPGS
jgi:nucleotide-binding universal stress UspA family protein